MERASQAAPASIESVPSAMSMPSVVIRSASSASPRRARTTPSAARQRIWVTASSVAPSRRDSSAARGRLVVLAGEREDPRLEPDHRRALAGLAATLEVRRLLPREAERRREVVERVVACTRGGTRSGDARARRRSSSPRACAASAPGRSPRIARRSAIAREQRARVSRRLVDPSSPSIDRPGSPTASVEPHTSGVRQPAGEVLATPLAPGRGRQLEAEPCRPRHLPPVGQR